MKKHIFAIWADDGYYYPATVTGTNDGQINVEYLDGTQVLLSQEDILEAQDAYDSLNFEADWQNGGKYYACKVTNTNPLTVEYKMDGVIEEIELSQLRAKAVKYKKNKIGQTLKGQTEPSSLPKLLIPIAAFTAVFVVLFFAISPVFKKDNSGAVRQIILDDSIITIDRVVEGSFAGKSEIPFTFYAPVAGSYYIQQTEGNKNRDDWIRFRLFNKRKKEINDGSEILERLEPGRHNFSVLSSGAKNYSFVITKDVKYTELPDREMQRLFVNAQAAPMYQDLEVVFTAGNQEVYYVMQVDEASAYQMSYSSKDIMSFRLYNDKFVRIDSGNHINNNLLPGTYYVAVGTNKSSAVGNFVLTKEGEYGWEKKQPEIFLGEIIRKAIEKGWDRMFRKSMLRHLSFIVGYLLTGLIFIAAYKFLFKPYMNYMENNYGYKVLGIPFWVMLAGIASVTLLPLAGIDPLGVREGNVIGGTKLTIVLLGTVILGTTAMSIILYHKSRKAILIPINIVVMFAFFYFVLQFVLYAIFIILAICGYVAARQMMNTKYVSKSEPQVNQYGPGVGKSWDNETMGYKKDTEIEARERRRANS